METKAQIEASCMETNLIWQSELLYHFNIALEVMVWERRNGSIPQGNKYDIGS